MEERETRRIEPGMDVCDLDGKKLGTVAELRPLDGAPAGPGSPAGGEVIEVKTGLLGLGKHLYIPLDAVHDVTDAGVFLSRRRDELDTSAWEQMPEFTTATAEVRRPEAEMQAPAAEVARPASEMSEVPNPAAAPATAAAQAPAQEAAAVATASAAGVTQSTQTTQAGRGNWASVADHYRARWEEHYGQQGATWESYEPRYRFAWEHGRDATLTGQGWYSAQPALREAWEARQPDTPWEQVADAVRDAWEHPAP